MSEEDSARQMPPVTFEFFVASLRMQAEIAMMPGPKEEDQPDLLGARHVIDILGLLQEKTKGNLTLEEKRLLENSLTELRFRYLQALEDSKKAKAAPGPEAAKA